MNKKGYMKEFIIALAIFACVIALIGTLIVHATETNQTDDGKYEYIILEDGTVEITKYIGSDTEITIPGIIDGKIVTSIGDFAFDSCYNITDIIIPEGVVSIGNNCFGDCSSLTTITIPEGVISIDDYSFWNCISLKSIDIPESVTNIGQNAFLFCYNLEEIKVEVNNQTYSSENGVLFDKQKTKLICYPEGKKDLEYIIPESVISIDEYSFSDFEYLNKIIIPASVISIDSNVFYFSGSLEEIIVAENNPNYCSVEGVLFNKDKTRIIKYPGEKTDLQYVIPETVTYIENWAFSDCYNLTKITIPDEVISIGEFSFYNCSNLTNIIIPEEVTSIEPYSFCGCSNLTNITIPEGVTSIGDSAFSNCRSLTEIKLPNTITSIGKDSFGGCYSLTQITIPENVTYIGSGVFKFCSSLEQITVAENNLHYCIEDGVLFNKDKTDLISYPIGKAPTEYSIPEGVKNIYDWAFYGCNNMKTIIIPEGIENIGNCAFGDIYSLTNLEISESVTEFGYAPFTGSNLVLVNCNDNILNIVTPEILKRAYDSEDVLYSEDITLTNCSLSEDLTQINVMDMKQNAIIEINSGALEGLTIKVNIHNWDSETGKCLVCGKECVHEYDEGTIWKEASCKEEGFKDYVCTICDGIKTETLEKLGHSFENGECTECGTKEEIENLEISSEDYIIKDSIITDIKPVTTIKDFVEKISTNGNIKIYKGETEIIANNAKIGTGMRVVITKDKEVKEFIAVVTGDLNGDGKMSDGDLLRLVRYRAGLDKTLAGVYLEAADIVKDNVPAKDSDILKFARVHAGLDNL